ncbi:MAG TPA: hypothetical protein VN749_20460 [Candidatus Eisenbacteria bacterium]|jgi:photosystem II stability/assembly factor-like uncharacterized protein|nr:hypothetical protein [Candidatus Eisenbacteria bacterium]
MVFPWVYVLLAALMLGGSTDRPGGFTVVGPGGGGAMFHPTVSPHDTETILVSCDMTGAYISHDGGKSWRMFNLRGVVEFFVFDPQNKNVIYAQATGLWRSSDNGDTWNLIYPKRSAVQGVRMNSDHSDEEILADPDPLGTISAMAIDPEDSSRFYVTTGNRKKGAFAIFVSHDAGDSWNKLGDLPDFATRIWVNPHSPAKDRTLVIAGLHFLAEKHGSGELQVLPMPPAKSLPDVSAGFSADGKAILYAVGDESAFVSDDAGRNWRKVALGAGAIKARAIATSLRKPDIAYVSYRDLQEGGVRYMGVAKTTDAGRTWQPVWKEDSNMAGKPAANVRDAWITERFGSDWGENPLALTVAEQDPNVSYGTDLGRAMRTTDGGATWVAVYSKRVDRGGWTSTGLDVTNAYGYHFDPFDHKRQFITTTDIGLFRSEDDGKSWISSTNGVPKGWVNTTYWIAFDPDVKGRVWSVNSGTHDLPRPKMWRHGGTAKYQGGVCISQDGGRTWVKSNDGMEQTAATHILVDPASPADARVLYVTGFGRGVYKSGDGGKSWQLKNTGILQKDPFAWRMVRDNKGMLYLLVARRSEDGSIGTNGDGAIYRSDDGAEHWSPMTLPQGVNAPNGLAIDAQDTRRLYLATWARATGQHGDGGGVFLSEDGGKTWRQVLDRDRHVYDVTIDPRDSRILYAAGFESSAWRSTDRGEHWQRIPGFNFKWGYRVIPDPEDERKVYITTFGGGVWHGALTSEDLLLDIATPELRPRN